MTNDHGRTAVYRCYDAAGTLLYIGSSNNPKFRYSEHARNVLKPWWPQVVRKDETWYDNRAAAQTAEIEAVKTEAPVHNVRLQAGAKTTVISVKLSEDQAARADVARGGLDRSAWLRSLVESAIGGIAAPAVALPRVVRQRQGYDAPAIYVEPAAVECDHPAGAVDGTYCRACRTDIW